MNERESEDRASKGTAPISPETTKSAHFKTAILAQINERDPEQVGATLLLDHYQHPIVIQFYERYAIHPPTLGAHLLILGA